MKIKLINLTCFPPGIDLDVPADIAEDRIKRGYAVLLEPEDRSVPEPQLEPEPSRRARRRHTTPVTEDADGDGRTIAGNDT